MTSTYDAKPRGATDERGISWNKGKWSVVIKRKGVRYHVGRFHTKREAMIAKDNFLRRQTT